MVSTHALIFSLEHATMFNTRNTDFIDTTLITPGITCTLQIYTFVHNFGKTRQRYEGLR
jgi:hypothetical protein